MTRRSRRRQLVAAGALGIVSCGALGRLARGAYHLMLPNAGWSGWCDDALIR
jgi:hypothetical protein